MGQFSIRGIEPWILKRIIAKLNTFTTAGEISKAVKDNPATGYGGYDIGETVAQRILDRRAEMPSDKFTSIGQLKAVSGLGDDKFGDLVYSFGNPSAELFRSEMYDRIIGYNWNLSFHRVEFADQDEFLALVDDMSVFREWMVYTIAELAEKRTGNCEVFEKVMNQISNATVEAYPNGHIASFVLALWFYRFDQDNWFTFDAVREVTENYLEFFTNPMERTELRMLYSFENQGLLAQPVTVNGLPVVVNYAERAITIWSAELID